jgi:hypothetical protein
MSEGTTTYWEIASFALQAAQAVLYLIALSKYKGKLEDYAEASLSWAGEDRGYYAEFRSADPDFYEYYMNLPEYEPCMNSVRRQRGVVFRKLGEGSRLAIDAMSAFRPLSRLKVPMDKIGQFAGFVQKGRAVQEDKEQVRKNAYVINKWSLISSAPTGAEGVNMSAGLVPMAKQAMDSFSAMGQGFNSALVGMGTIAYRRNWMQI